MEYTTAFPGISVCACVDEVEIEGNGPRVAVKSHTFAERCSPKCPKGRGGSCHVKPITGHEKEAERVPGDPTAGVHARDDVPPKDITKDFRG